VVFIIGFHYLFRNTTQRTAPQFRRHAGVTCGLAKKMQHGSTLCLKKRANCGKL